MAVNSAVVDNLNHISHFHTSLSQFLQFFQQITVWVLQFWRDYIISKAFFGSSSGGGERIPDSRIITDQSEHQKNKF